MGSGSSFRCTRVAFTELARSSVESTSVPSEIENQKLHRRIQISV